MSKAPNRQLLHELVDRIRPSEIAWAEEYLSKLIDPLELSLLMAEPDDEPITEDDLRSFASAEERQRRGEPGIPHLEVLRDLGLTESDLQ